MKKIVMMSIALLMMGACAMAQNNGNSQRGQGMQRGGQGRQMDVVVDTAVINHIDLSQEMLQQVYALQTKKQEEMRSLMGNNRQRGQRMSDEERQQRMKQMQEFGVQYRKELRALIGDDAYITYLEKQVERQAQARFNNQQRGMQRGGQRQGDWNGQRQGDWNGPRDMHRGGFDNGGSDM